jgi:hypothetical protein
MSWAFAILTGIVLGVVVGLGLGCATIRLGLFPRRNRNHVED